MTDPSAHSWELVPGSNARIFEALASSGAFGICLFDEYGLITGRIGVREAFLPDIGGNIEDSPLFVGLMQSVRRLKSDGGFLDLPSLGMDARTSLRFDLRISWLESAGVFAAMVYPASERISFEFTVAQAARENRLLLEKIKLQQEQILAQNELMRIFVSHVPAAVAMLDKDMNYLMVSERWQQDLAGPDISVLHKPFAKGVPPGARRWQSALALGEKAAASGIEKIVDKEGAVAWHRWERQGWPAGGENAGGTLVFSENITKAVAQTARLRAQASRLASLNAEMQQFALAVSHDLRAPIRQIGAFAQFLADDHAGSMGEEAAEYVSLIRQCAARMLGMIDALLVLAKISQAQAQPARFGLATLVRNASANLGADIAARGASIDCADNAEILGDLALLTLVFQNLIDNSLKYAKAKPLHISVGIVRLEPDLVLHFTDNGPGIAPHLQAKAFDLFQRLGAPPSTSGAGVGLAMCRKIVELQGGTLAIDGEFTGGLRFELHLPGGGAKAMAS